MTATLLQDPAGPPGTALKRCTRCGTWLRVHAFRLLRDRWRSSWCGPCSVAATREWRRANRDAINARRRQVAP
jgi:hypothetical protein